MIDITSRLDRTQARKTLSEILNRSGAGSVSFSRHCREELKKDNLTHIDVFNVLKAGLIYEDPEWINGSYRYRVETNKVVVVISFIDIDLIRCVTAWRKQR